MAAGKGTRAAALPWGGVFALCLGNAAHFYSICSLFSYAGVMCVDLGWVTNRTRAGFVAGFLASANTLGRVPFAPLWGRFADCHGSSLALQRNFASIAVGCLLFGFCTNFTAAILVRGLLLGAGNGWATVFCLAALEVADAENQSRVTAFVFASGQLVTLVAPALGGFTYGLVPRFPSIVPNLCGVVLALAALLACRAWLPRPGAGYRQCDDAQGTAGGTELANGEEGQAGEAEVRPSKLSDRLPICKVVRGSFFPLLIALRAVFGFTTFSMFDVFPLWAIASLTVGGLDMSQQELGSTLSSSALLALPAISLVHRPIEAWGLRASTAASTFAKVASLCLMPFFPHWASVLGFYVVYTVAGSLQGVAFISMTNNAAPAGQRGAVNGVAVALECVGKGLGPMTGALLFAWSVATFGELGHSLAFLVLALLELFLASVGCLPGAVEALQLPPAGAASVAKGLYGFGEASGGSNNASAPAPQLGETSGGSNNASAPAPQMLGSEWEVSRSEICWVSVSSRPPEGDEQDRVQLDMPGQCSSYGPCIGERGHEI